MVRTVSGQRSTPSNSCSSLLADANEVSAANRQQCFRTALL